jgi:hypothetical protein
MSLDRSRAARALLTVGWAGGALACSRVDAVAALVPALGSLRGPLGTALGLVALAVAVRQLWGPAGELRDRDVPAAWAFALPVLAFLSVGLFYTTRLRVSGDEPHYLLMAQSLWRERDLDLRDNLDRGDFLEYTPGPVVPHYAAPRSDGRPFPAHSAGLPALLAPVYAAGGRPAVVIALALAAAGVAVLVRGQARQVMPGTGAATAAWAAAAGPPVLFYAFHVYTEVPAAAALAGALVLVERARSPASPDRGSARGAAWPAAGAGLLAGVLPWLHLKMAPACLVLALVAGVSLRGVPLLAFAAAGLVPLAGLAAFQHSVFGSASLLSAYGGFPRDASGDPLRAGAGLLLDRSFGLLPHAPVFLLAAPGALHLVRRRLVVASPLLAVGAAVLAPVLVWRMWWGGQCPPARFLVPLVPLLGVAVGACVARGSGLARWMWPLAGLGLGLALFMVWRPGELMLLNRGSRPTRVWDALGGQYPVGRYLPSLVSAEAAEVKVALVWGAALALLLALDAAAPRRAGVDRLFRGLGLPLFLLLAVSLGVDYWARAG